MRPPSRKGRALHTQSQLPAMALNLKHIAAVPTAKDFIDIVLSRTQRQTPTVVHRGARRGSLSARTWLLVRAYSPGCALGRTSSMQSLASGPSTCARRVRGRCRAFTLPAAGGCSPWEACGPDRLRHARRGRWACFGAVFPSVPDALTCLAWLRRVETGEVHAAGVAREAGEDTGGVSPGGRRAPLLRGPHERAV